MILTFDNIKKNIIPISGFFTLIVATYLAYSGISDQEILSWDDALYVLENEHIRTFTFENIVWMFTNHGLSNWHPLTWLSYTFNYSIWGPDPYSFKFLNVAIHILNSILVYFLTFKILLLVQKKNCNQYYRHFVNISANYLSLGSIVAAILFAAHPIHVESVSWIAERKDVLSAFFFLASLITYLKYKTLHEKNNWLLVTLILYICSLMSKPMGVTTPIVLILIDIYLFPDHKKPLWSLPSISNLLKDKVTFIIISILISLITIVTQWYGIEGIEKSSITSRIINAAMSIILYLYNFLFPTNLSPFYPHHHWSSDPNLYSAIPIVTVLSFTGYFIYLYKKNIQFPLIAWLYFIITLLPVIGIVKVGWQAAADRYTYLPMLSIYIVIGAGLSMLASATKRSKLNLSVLSTFVALIFCLLFLQTYRANLIWENDKSFWNYVRTKYPGTAHIAYRNLGATNYAEGKFREAITNYAYALAIAPGDIIVLKNMAKAYEKLKKENLVLATYNEIIQYHPEKWDGYAAVGDYFYRHKNIAAAKAYYRTAFLKNPARAATLQRSALVDYLESNYDIAIEKLVYLLKLNPNDIGGLQLAAKVYLSNGDKKMAELMARKVLRLNPKDSFAIDVMNKLYSTKTNNQ